MPFIDLFSPFLDVSLIDLFSRSLFRYELQLSRFIMLIFAFVWGA